MKRDFDLIRIILQIIEKFGNGNLLMQINECDLKIYKQNYSQDMIDEHLLLLHNKNFIRANPTQTGWIITGLTWEGHDFLANANHSDLWDKAKKCAGNLSFNIFSNLLTKSAENLAETLLKNL
jgi:hypothetical protein